MRKHNRRRKKWKGGSGKPVQFNGVVEDRVAVLAGSSRYVGPPPRVDSQLEQFKELVRYLP